MVLHVRLFMVAFVALTLIGPAMHAAQDEDEATPAAPQAPPPAHAVEGVIRATRGVLTQIRLAPDAPWQQAQVGMRVPIGAELRTGPRSMIQFLLPPDQLVTVDRATVITLLQASQAGRQVTTDIGMVRGRTTYQVTDPNVQHAASVRSPNATNAVRGTQEFGVTDDALFGAFVFAINTPSTVTNSEGEEIPFGGEGEESEMSGEVASEGEQSFLDSILDPFNGHSRTENEKLLVGRFPATGGLDTNRLRSDVVQATPTEFFEDQLLTPSGRLVALLLWNTTADLDIFAIDSDGYHISSFAGVGDGFVTSAPNGGRAGPDITSGPATEFIVYQNQTIPTGNIEVGAAYFDGPDSDFTIQVFKDGQQVGSDFTGRVGPNNLQESTTFTVPADNVQIDTVNPRAARRSRRR